MVHFMINRGTADVGTTTSYNIGPMQEQHVQTFADIFSDMSDNLGVDVFAGWFTYTTDVEDGND